MLSLRLSVQTKLYVKKYPLLITSVLLFTMEAFASNDLLSLQSDQIGLGCKKIHWIFMIINFSIRLIYTIYDGSPKYLQLYVHINLYLAKCSSSKQDTK